jgi:hypothetical protein
LGTLNAARIPDALGEQDMRAPVAQNRRRNGMTVRTITLLVAMLSIPAVLLAADDPIMGKWAMNVSKTRSPRPALKSSIRRIESIPDGMKVTREGVSANGKPLHSGYSPKFNDGKFYPAMDSDIDEIMAVRLNPYTLETIAKIQLNGEIRLELSRWEFSKDGKSHTQTIRHVGGPESGFVTVLVYERVPE